MKHLCLCNFKICVLEVHYQYLTIVNLSTMDGNRQRVSIYFSIFQLQLCPFNMNTLVTLCQRTYPSNSHSTIIDHFTINKWLLTKKVRLYSFYITFLVINLTHLSTHTLIITHHNHYHIYLCNQSHCLFIHFLFNINSKNHLVQYNLSIQKLF